MKRKPETNRQVFQFQEVSFSGIRENFSDDKLIDKTMEAYGENVPAVPEKPSPFALLPRDFNKENPQTEHSEQKRHAHNCFNTIWGCRYLGGKCQFSQTDE